MESDGYSMFCVLFFTLYLLSAAVTILSDYIDCNSDVLLQLLSSDNTDSQTTMLHDQTSG